MHRVLAINPGSTSTKIAVYEDETPAFEESIRHEAADLAQYPRVADQYAFRRDAVLDTLKAHAIAVESLDAIVGRGDCCAPSRAVRIG